ncbi:hypothetical protein Tco_0953176 [Tanacetum coccineum]|uniref:Uncharacterized protein n=1 Tax=Tanacetum coccineum TaxID=301880 RepID=A0ABQ5E220_9ASTR
MAEFIYPCKGDFALGWKNRVPVRGIGICFVGRFSLLKLSYCVDLSHVSSPDEILVGLARDSLEVYPFGISAGFSKYFVSSTALDFSGQKKQCFDEFDFSNPYNHDAHTPLSGYGRLLRNFKFASSMDTVSPHGNSSHAKYRFFCIFFDASFPPIFAFLAFHKGSFASPAS